MFTDDKTAVRRLDGTSAYEEDGEIAAQMGRICHLSQAFYHQGVHLELHYGPGHAGLPGNEAADTMAGQYREQFALEMELAGRKQQDLPQR
ncbi:uncharacterized protein N7529_010797 [Penicillium soppii]|jgi:ribonuclease HI|uniref:uncharacterized protein n=1 Tax=Penicillium soppii TaxID=69789 RepID=UPI002546DBA9|nr:uncharacterized protein N7529_010797 [Penicillium soppii]KAJ5851412.1 hypothetical protein N7529_010797 [Penicillium soppii]